MTRKFHIRSSIIKAFFTFPPPFRPLGYGRSPSSTRLIYIFRNICLTHAQLLPFSQALSDLQGVLYNHGRFLVLLSPVSRRTLCVLATGELVASLFPSRSFFLRIFVYLLIAFSHSPSSTLLKASLTDASSSAKILYVACILIQFAGSQPREELILGVCCTTGVSSGSAFSSLTSSAFSWTFR